MGNERTGFLGLGGDFEERAFHTVELRWPPFHVEGGLEELLHLFMSGNNLGRFTVLDKEEVLLVDEIAILVHKPVERHVRRVNIGIWVRAREGAVGFHPRPFKSESLIVISVEEDSRAILLAKLMIRVANDSPQQDPIERL